PEGPEEGQAFYVGGSETGGGGQQVLGPPRKSTNHPLPDPNSAPDEFVHRLFQAAKGQGAEVLDTERYSERSEKKKIYVPFSGTGYKLGEDPSAPSVIAQGPGTSMTTNSTAKHGEEHSVVVKMWRDGFSLDDGPLRSYNDPASRSFLEEIQAGTVPQELIRSACGGLVNLLLEDHHHEAWRAPPTPKVKPFSGTGTMLGHPTPRLVPSNPTVVPHTEPSSSLPGPEVDESKPVTQIQVRMPDGGRLILRLNHSHTVADVRLAIVSQRPSLAACAFNLLTAFPSRELTDDTQTLKDANLLNSSLLIRLAQ
ncbi:Protein tyrosine phosphatase shp1/cofactor for p97 atpase-mediated vesicle membrane fusion, partial [Fasciolopsis buskii]